MIKKLNLILSSFVVASLVACGGGGGGTSTASATVTSTLSFPIATGIKALQVSGLAKNFAVTGSCTGNGTRTSTPENTPSVFEGVTGFSDTDTLVVTLSAPCSSTTQTSTSYVDTNYVQLGYSSTTNGYGVYLTRPTYPTSVSVGSTGTIGTENLYTDSTKTVSKGTTVGSYTVTADTATTAIFNVIWNSYDASAKLTATEQDSFRVDALGAVTPITTDILYTSGTHVLITYI